MFVWLSNTSAVNSYLALKLYLCHRAFEKKSGDRTGSCLLVAMEHAKIEMRGNVSSSAKLSQESAWECLPGLGALAREGCVRIPSILAYLEEAQK
jgi:hypothetical protein